MTAHNKLGNLGEQIACAYLIKKGYRILAQNWRYLKNEIDIITIHKNTLVIIEVKTRTSTYFGKPETFVSTAQQKRICKAADAYLQISNLDIEVRFDIISIIKNTQQQKIEHIKDAFSSFG